ncbi:MAG: diaminopimelate epimerase [Thermodesulfobacteriota bacterium]
MSELSHGPVQVRKVAYPLKMDYIAAMEVEFQKMHGTMNDFVVMHDFAGALRFTPEQVRRVCDRRAGVGGDGIIVVRDSANADFFMDYVNADGSLAEMCGNGIRCLAKYVYDNRLTDKKLLPVETRAGVKNVELLPGDDGKIRRVRVDMGKPIFSAQEIPVKLETDGSPILDQRIEVEGRTFSAAILSMGNPHCVIILDEDVEPLPRRFGPALEHHALFPARTNTEFVRVAGQDRLIMRVWERGSGETFACGTGACATAVAARLKGFVGESCTVSLLGGDLEIQWKGMNNSVIMTGDAETTFRGSLSI